MIRNDMTKKITRLAMLGALSIVLALLIHLPIIPAAPFLEYDPADIPLLIATFLYGPWWGLALTAVVSVIQGLTVSAASGWIGIVMHVLATGSLCTVAGGIYQRKKTMGRAVLGLAAGALSMTAIMIPLNLAFIPLLYGASMEMVVALILPAIIPFNLLKAGINAVVTFIIYKPISKLFSRAAQNPKTELPNT